MVREDIGLVGTIRGYYGRPTRDYWGLFGPIGVPRRL